MNYFNEKYSTYFGMEPDVFPSFFFQIFISSFCLNFLKLLHINFIFQPIIRNFRQDEVMKMQNRNFIISKRQKLFLFPSITKIDTRNASQKIYSEWNFTKKKSIGSCEIKFSYHFNTFIRKAIITQNINETFFI